MNHLLATSGTGGWHKAGRLGVRLRGEAGRSPHTSSATGQRVTMSHFAAPRLRGFPHKMKTNAPSSGCHEDRTRCVAWKRYDNCQIGHPSSPLRIYRLVIPFGGSAASPLFESRLDSGTSTCETGRDLNIARLLDISLFCWAWIPETGMSRRLNQPAGG